MGNFLAIVGEGIIVTPLKLRVSPLFSTESVIMARAPKAAAAVLMVEVAMADRGLELGRNFGGKMRILGIP